MNASNVAHSRVAARGIATRNIQGRLCQRAHALIMKRALGNVTLALGNTAVRAGDKSCMHSRKINHSRRPKANRIRARINSPRELGSSAAHGFNNLADCINHELRLFFVYFVAAIRVGNVLFVGHKLG